MTRPDVVARLRPVLAEARRLLTAAEASDSGWVADSRILHSMLERWANAIESIVTDADIDTSAPTAKELVGRVLLGESIEIAAAEFNLHDMTQIATALQPGASVTVHNSESLSPIEQASISSVMLGQVRFV